MTESDFLLLDVNPRADKVWADGEFIGSREYYGYKIVLYVLERLYVEVWYFIATNKIEKVEPISNSKDLNHYLKDVDIENLMSGYPYPGKE
jgi:hypothetical protein